jgi:hypothetical protein
LITSRNKKVGRINKQLELNNWKEDSNKHNSRLLTTKITDQKPAVKLLKVDVQWQAKNQQVIN